MIIFGGLLINMGMFCGFEGGFGVFYSHGVQMYILHRVCWIIKILQGGIIPRARNFSECMSYRMR